VSKGNGVLTGRRGRASLMFEEDLFEVKLITAETARALGCSTNTVPDVGTPALAACLPDSGRPRSASATSSSCAAAPRRARNCWGDAGD
jgi:hypothetical protein